MYHKGMRYFDYLMKLRSIKDKTSVISWKFPPNFSKYFHSFKPNRLAIDFFTRMCSYPPSERYDAKSALRHPWITGVVDAEIPLTYKQQIKRYNSEQEFRKIVRTVCFIA